jgi:hypothetical protein
MILLNNEKAAQRSVIRTDFGAVGGHSNFAAIFKNSSRGALFSKSVNFDKFPT